LKNSATHVYKRKLSSSIPKGMKVISLFSLSYSVVKTLVSSQKDICDIISYFTNNIMKSLIHFDNWVVLLLFVIENASLMKVDAIV
jgi:hypothetical protein